MQVIHDRLAQGKPPELTHGDFGIQDDVLEEMRARQKAQTAGEWEPFGPMPIGGEADESDRELIVATVLACWQKNPHNVRRMLFNIISQFAGPRMQTRGHVTTQLLNAIQDMLVYGKSFKEIAHSLHSIAITLEMSREDE